MLKVYITNMIWFFTNSFSPQLETLVEKESERKNQGQGNSCTINLA